MRNNKKIFMIFILIIFNLSYVNASASEDKIWEPKAGMHIARCFHATAVVNGKIYVIGGFDNEGNVLDSVEEYDPITNTWVIKSSMPTARRSLSAVTVNGKIYAIGGRNSQLLNDIEEYDPQTNKWTIKKAMPKPMTNKSIAYNNKIYLMGINTTGYTNGSNEVWEYDPIDEKWTKKADMLTKRSSIAIALIDGKIYAMGGSSFNNGNVFHSTVEEYNLTQDKWTSKADMLTGRNSLGAVVVGEKIYAIGGNNKSGPEVTGLTTVEQYNPLTNKWTSMKGIPTGRHGLSVVQVDNDIYAIGGYKSNKQISNIVEMLSFPKPQKPVNLTATSMNNKVNLSWDENIDVQNYIVKRKTTQTSEYKILNQNIKGNTFIDYDVEPGLTYYYVVQSVKDGVESEESNVASATIKGLDNKVKLVLEVNEQKQLSVTNDLTDNTKMVWTSSDTNIATVDANGKVKALKPGDTVITCKTEDGSYTEAINVLVVDLDLQLAVDLNIGEKCRLTVSDLNNVKVTWKADDSTIATVSTKGKVTAISEGLTYITALDETGKELGRIYVRIR